MNIILITILIFVIGLPILLGLAWVFDFVMSYGISENDIEFYWQTWAMLNVTPPRYAKMAIERIMKEQKNND
jgi:hypothetical protein